MFPTLATGALVCRPWSRTRNYSTAVSRNETGQQYAWNWRASGVPNFPDDALMSWELSFGPITRDELDIFETFFNDMQGRYGTFTFKDPQTLVDYAKCRFAMDSLDVSYDGPGEYSIKVQIEEFF